MDEDLKLELELNDLVGVNNTKNSNDIILENKMVSSDEDTNASPQPQPRPFPMPSKLDTKSK